MDSTEDTDPMAPRLETTELAAAAAPSSCRRCACGSARRSQTLALTTAFFRLVHIL